MGCQWERSPSAEKTVLSLSVVPYSPAVKYFQNRKIVAKINRAPATLFDAKMPHCCCRHGQQTGDQHAQYTLMAHHQQVLAHFVIIELSNEAFHAQGKCLKTFAISGVAFCQSLHHTA